MDIFFIMVGGVAGVMLLAASLDNINRLRKGLLFASMICFLCFLWGITATIVKQPEVTYHRLQNINIEGKTFQVINYNGNVVNITQKFGLIFDEGQTIKAENYCAVWSLGVFCIMGRPKFSVVDTVEEE